MIAMKSNNNKEQPFFKQAKVLLFQLYRYLRIFKNIQEYSRILFKAFGEKKFFEGRNYLPVAEKVEQKWTRLLYCNGLTFLTIYIRKYKYLFI